MKNKKRYLLLAGILYQSLTSFAQNTSVADFTINSQQVSAYSATDFFTNNALELENHTVNNNHVVRYELSVTDATWHTLYSTGPVNGTPAQNIDLYHMCSNLNSAGCSSLSAGTKGTFGIILTTSTNHYGLNPSTYRALIKLVYPVANPPVSSFKINNNAVNAHTPVIFNGPQTMQLEYTGSGTVGDWRVDLLDPVTYAIDYTTDDVAGAMPASLDMYNWCNVSQSSVCSSLNAQVTGTFLVRLYESCCSAGDPDASISYGLITINPAVPAPSSPLSAAFTISNQNVSVQTATRFF